MNNVSLTINGQKVTAPEGSPLLWAAQDNGIYIPNLCALRQTRPAAACRLCFVSIEGYRQPVTACTEPVREAMAVDTRSPAALELARAGFELIMASHPVDCARCPANKGACELQKIAAYLKVSLNPRHLRKIHRNLPVDTSCPGFIYNADRCVLCGRCVTLSRQLGSGKLGFAGRGFDRTVTTFDNQPVAGLGSDELAAYAGVCPAGAFCAVKNK